MQLGKLLRLEQGFGKKFSDELDLAFHHQAFTSRWWSLSDMITNIFVMISRFLVIGFGVYFIMHGELSIAGFILIFSYLGQIYYPLAGLFGSLPQLQRWGTEIAEFYEIFEYTDSEDLENGDSIEVVQGRITLQGVNFGYHSERGILHHLSLTIEPGQKIALVGNTGAGKSTIISLLLRFWEPDSGKILLDGKNIADIRKSDLRRHIGMVAQDNSLFNLSIRENLLFAKPDATDDELRTALENASATFVYSLEDGIDTIIGERGLKLSGGEKQRLSIARLFLQNPEILIFDEATSALDTLTEKSIQESMNRLTQGKTTIIIAHRLSTIRDVDRIFMLENGRVIESGNYDELVAAGGKFAALTDPSRLVVS